MAAGTYNLTAVATDNAGATATSQPVTITVAAPANKPPTVSITAPAASASYTAPASISITATAADADGSVTRVDFYAGTQLVGSDTSTPFSVSWSGVAAGNYSLTAVATDNTGAKTTSAGCSGDGCPAAEQAADGVDIDTGRRHHLHRACEHVGQRDRERSRRVGGARGFLCGHPGCRLRHVEPVQCDVERRRGRDVQPDGRCD